MTAGSDRSQDRSLEAGPDRERQDLARGALRPALADRADDHERNHWRDLQGEHRAACAGRGRGWCRNQPEGRQQDHLGDPLLDGPTRLYLKDTYSGIVLDDAGLARPKPQDTTGFALEISEENIKQADADKTFVTTYEDEEGLALRTKEAFENNPLWRPLEPRVVEVSDTSWMTAVSIQGAYHILTDLAETFEVETPNIL